ncbi:MAG TPA: AI-2E family transporter [Acidimicrobiales bacterium]|jgi:predicted PurR-regulated permease PerM|nr:AI-2E family transporter [Acidimicrobiales bacterium]
MSPEPAAPSRPVPWRTIWAAIGSVVATLAAITVVQAVSRILIWILIAGFFAIVLSPPVDWLEHRARMRRSLATILVFLFGLSLVGGLMYAFITPIVDQSQEFADNFPRYVEEAKAGEGPLGGLVQRFDLDRRIEERRDDFEKALNDLGRNSLDIVRGVGNAVAATLTILVLTILMLLSGPRMLRTGLGALSPPNAERVRHVAADCAKAVTGYVAGNLLISVIAGVASFIFFLVADVPFRTVLALWVAFADLIPLVGATLGAIPAVIVAFLNSTALGIATVVFFVVYQQFENHVLQVTIMSKTVDLNPLVVLVAVLIGVELTGILGALLAIPVAGVIQVLGRDIYDERRGRLKDEPTVGSEQVPVSELAASGEPPDASVPEPATDPAPLAAEPAAVGAGESTTGESSTTDATTTEVRQ